MPAFQGAIFDIDGVLVDSPHEKAWRESLRELMEGEWNDIRAQTAWSPGASTPQVYQEEISGKPRLSAARKQEMVVRLIQTGDSTRSPSSRESRRRCCAQA